MKNWFNIDKEGLAKILARKGKEFAVFELVQNAWDEEGVTEVFITLCPAEIPGYAMLVVEDNAPHGFSDITHAYTLFAESNKKSNPEKRGRFNLGEKLVLAMSREASVATTTGMIIFDKNGRHNFPSRRRDTGSQVTFLLRMTDQEITDAVRACRKLVPPAHVITSVNKQILEPAKPVSKFRAALTTEIADPEGNLVRGTRTADVAVYLATLECPAAIYEMGIPVTEIDGRYIFDVAQKVPLTMDREEVLPSFRKQLAVAVINNLPPALLDSNDANTSWATEALTSPDATAQAIETCMTQKFGMKRVAYDPSDIEANHRAAAAGYTVVTGGQLSGAAWQNVKRVGAVLPAGQVTPSPKPYGENGKPLTLVKEKTPGMLEVEEYAKKFACAILDCGVSVQFAAEVTWPYAATYGPGNLTFNVGRLGKTWFDLAHNHQQIDDLLIHEFGHHYSSNHLSEEYYNALTLIGSKLAQALRAGKL